ncbi:MAG: peptidoglycan DD-metalloendopeptidase family protein [Anaerolineae bacterium]|nr:peptidoglycan DD-metalloendopeptidase family protein [Anaerolineae bacterium]
MRHDRWRVVVMIFAMVAYALQMGSQPVFAAISDNVVSDYEFLTAEANFYGVQLQQVLILAGSPLAGYQETIGGQEFTAGDLIWLASQQRDFGLNPKVLVATLDIQQGLQPVPQGELSSLMNEMAEKLWTYSVEYQAGARTVELPNQQTIAMDTGVNAATFALAKYFSSKSDTEETLRTYLQQWTQTYIRLFQRDPRSGVGMEKGITPVAPFLRLPFNQPAGGLIKVNAFFDHHLPRTLDDYLMRFDGKGYTSSSFSNCSLWVNCYGGHNAIDYGLSSGTPVYAAAAGTVVYRYLNKDASQGAVDSGLIIDHGNGYRTLYWHQDVIYVKQGDVVSKGQLIGLSGNVGKSSGPHLHFGLRLTNGSKDIDPYGWWASTADPWDGSFWAWEGDLVADVGEAQTQLFYGTYWTREIKGYQGDAWWTYGMTDAAKIANWGIWGTYIPVAGQYHVYAYWPTDANATTGATYRIFHAGGVSSVTVNQSVNGDRFNLLGTYYFNQGRAAVVMDDLTLDAKKRQYFDAVKWEPAATSSPVEAGLRETLDDNHSLIAYSGYWSYENYGSANPYGLYSGTAHVSTAVGSAATFKFRGNSFSLIYYAHPTCGQLKVEIDGVQRGVISQYAPARQVQQRWDSGLLTNGDHVVKMTHLSGQYVTIDAVEITREIIPSVAGPGVYDNTDSRLVFTGKWVAGTSPDTYNRTYHYSSSPGSTVSLTFTGTRVAIIFSKKPDYGNVMVDIDYVYVPSPKMSAPQPVYQQRWDSPPLPTGNHTVTMAHISGGAVEIDAIVVQ